MSILKTEIKANINATTERTKNTLYNRYIHLSYIVYMIKNVCVECVCVYSLYIHLISQDHIFIYGKFALLVLCLLQRACSEVYYGVVEECCIMASIMQRGLPFLENPNWTLKDCLWWSPPIVICFSKTLVQGHNENHSEWRLYIMHQNTTVGRVSVTALVHLGCVGFKNDLSGQLEIRESARCLFAGALG